MDNYQRILLILGILYTPWFLFAQSSSLQPLPEKLTDIPSKPSPARFINDFANMLTMEEERLLEYKLRNYEDSTSTQLVIVAVYSLNGYNLEEYAIQIAREWGIGQREKDNGLLILISKSEHKIRLEIGYGLEGVVSDIMAGRIITNYLQPNFRKGAYYKGLDEATDTIIGLTNGLFKPTHLSPFWNVGRIFGYFTFVLLLISMFVSYARVYRRMMIFMAVGWTGIVEYIFVHYEGTQESYIWLVLSPFYVILYLCFNYWGKKYYKA